MSDPQREIDAATLRPLADYLRQYMWGVTEDEVEALERTIALLDGPQVEGHLGIVGTVDVDRGGCGPTYIEVEIAGGKDLKPGDTVAVKLYRPPLDSDTRHTEEG